RSSWLTDWATDRMRRKRRCRPCACSTGIRTITWTRFSSTSTVRCGRRAGPPYRSRRAKNCLRRHRKHCRCRRRRRRCEAYDFACGNRRAQRPQDTGVRIPVPGRYRHHAFGWPGHELEPRSLSRPHPRASHPCGRRALSRLCAGTRRRHRSGRARIGCAMNWPITTMQIESEADVVAVRQRARHLAELLGFERRDQTRIATAVSEIARNAFSFAKNGRAEFAVDDTQKRPIFNIRISDSGKGIADLDAALEGRPGSAEGTGRGMMGAKRLVDRFEAKSESGKGTIIDLGQILPLKAGKLSRAKVAEIARALQPVRSEDPMAIMREQNRELMQSLEELRQRRSENEQLSRELADTNRGVVALYAELNGQADKLKQASELKTRFLSNMSHEFRTPLNSILALSRLLLDRIDGPLTTEQQKQVTYIRRSAEGLLELVNDLLDLAKVEAGKIDIRPTAFTVEGLFGALRGALKPLQTNAAVELTFDSQSDVPELFTDEQKVSQVLRNLISNALKFTEEGEVTVSAVCDSSDGRVMFSVRDTGI